MTHEPHPSTGTPHVTPPGAVSLRRYLLRPLWLPFLLLLVIMASVAWSVSRNAAAMNAVRASQRAITLSQELLNSVVDLETGERGFIITQNPRFLEPYEMARARIPSELAALRGAVAEHEGEVRARHEQQLARIEQLIREWLATVGEPAVALARTDPGAAVALVKAGYGISLTDEIRRIIADFQQEERTEQQIASLASSAALRQTLVVTVLGALTAAALLLAVFARAAAQVERALAEVSAATSRVARGERGALVPTSRIAQVSALAANFNTMAAQLAEQERSRSATLAALTASEARTRALINAIPDILMTVAPDGTIRTFKPPGDEENQAWVDAMIGQRVRDVLPASAANPLMEGVRCALESGGPYRTEFSLDMASITPEAPGVRDFEARFVPVLGEEALVISRDITDRKRVEQLKNEFVSTVSHELRTPLTSIRGSLSLIASGVLGQLQPRGQKLVSIALSNSERLVRLINDILDIDKIESGKLEFHDEAVNLGQLVLRAADDNHAFAEQYDARLETHVPDAPVLVWGDPDRLLQVLTNLISNAVKFTPAGSAVTVRVEQRDGWARVEVRDRGPGVPEAFRFRIFQRFAQADSGDTRQQGGTGLGLSISKAIIDRHGGRIGFEDHEGGGTVFWFELRAHAPAEAAARAPQRRVLVCEDDADVANLLSLVLRERGVLVDTVYSAEDAEAALRERAYDALLLDLMLPGKDGLTLIRDLRRDERTANLPIVVLSAVADEQRHVLNGDAIGIVDWLSKPIDVNALMRSLSRATRAAPGGTLRVLHVDDDPDLRHVVQELLRGTAEATPAHSLAEARALLAVAHFDLVLLDVALPDGSGLDLLAELQRTHPPVPVLVFSASELERADLERVAASLVKSRTSNEELIDLIQALIETPDVDGGGTRAQ